MALDKVRGLFSDETFVRMWRLYLAGSIAAFETGVLQLFQVLFTKQDNNDLPLTREYLYGE
jgi:cyclopropane-fatty-acyl-phospholipid synthase